MCVGATIGLGRTLEQAAVLAEDRQGGLPGGTGSWRRTRPDWGAGAGRRPEQAASCRKAGKAGFRAG